MFAQAVTCDDIYNVDWILDVCCCFASANNYNDDGRGHGDCHGYRRFA